MHIDFLGLNTFKLGTREVERRGGGEEEGKREEEREEREREKMYKRLDERKEREIVREIGATNYKDDSYIPRFQ